MALPRPDIPKYEITLPVSGAKIKYRPFVVAEEKILLLSLQEDNPEHIVTAIEQIIEQCTFGEVNMDKYSQLDIEYLFLNIRNKSLGEGVEVVATCVECEKKSNLTLDLSHVKIKKSDKEVKPEIKLSDTMWVVLKYPSVKETYKLTSSESDDVIINVLAASIDMIIDGDKTYSASEYKNSELIEWIGGLTKQQLEAINEFFEAAPKLVYENEFTCMHCGAKNTIKMEGLQNFFD